MLYQARYSTKQMMTFETQYAQLRFLWFDRFGHVIFGLKENFVVERTLGSFSGRSLMFDLFKIVPSTRQIKLCSKIRLNLCQDRSTTTKIPVFAASPCWSRALAYGADQTGLIFVIMTEHDDFLHDGMSVKNFGFVFVDLESKRSKSYKLNAKQKILVEEGIRFFLIHLRPSEYGWTLIKENKINNPNGFDLALYSIRLCHDDRSARLVLKNNLNRPLPVSSIDANRQFLYIVRFSDPLMNIFDSAKNVWHEKRIGLFHKEHTFAGNAQYIAGGFPSSPIYRLQSQRLWNIDLRFPKICRRRTFRRPAVLCTRQFTVGSPNGRYLVAVSSTKFLPNSKPTDLKTKYFVIRLESTQRPACISKLSDLAFDVLCNGSEIYARASFDAEFLPESILRTYLGPQWSRRVNQEEEEECEPLDIDVF